MSAFADNEGKDFVVLDGSLDWRAVSSGVGLSIMIDDRIAPFVRSITGGRTSPHVFVGGPIDLFVGTSRQDGQIYRIVTPAFLVKMSYQKRDRYLELRPEGLAEANEGWLERRFRSREQQQGFLGFCGLDAATAGNPTVPTIWKDNGTALWQDALAQAKTERARWPYDWVNGVDYPHKDQRGNVTGQIILKDPQAATTKLPNLTVGLSHPDYTSNAGGFVARAGNGNTITWDHDGNYYQFWNDGAEDGKFTITNVRPGTYTLHAFADGVLGEFARTNIKVEAGKDQDLGSLDWQPVRDGKQIWEIGYPNRNASEFFKGDGANYWLWGWYVRYGELFPNDITYTVGKSDWHKDWFIEQVPHALSTAWKNPAAKDPLNQPFGWINLATGQGQDMWSAWGRGRATTWTIKFNMDKIGPGQATLRIALGGADGNGGLAIGVNGTAVGTLHPVATNALRYNTERGVWREYAQPFDAALLKAGENSVTLTVPAGDLTTGVCYDYLRLELQEK